jgi:hypothetical protein
VPKVKGGLTVRQNLIPACLACNSHKSGADWLEWYQTQGFHNEIREMAIAAWLQQL